MTAPETNANAHLQLATELLAGVDEAVFEEALTGNPALVIRRATAEAILGLAIEVQKLHSTLAETPPV